MTKAILLDVEGTTTSIDFVHKTLFPYSQSALPTFIEEQSSNKQVQSCLTQAEATMIAESKETKTSFNNKEIVSQLLTWIKNDRKHPALKELQGIIWEDGYRTKAYVSHIYDDVPTALAEWTNQGISVSIYSSGSERAQQLLFKYSKFGDLTKFISHYFDTRIGHKREPQSYHEISNQLKTSPQDILFLSDVEQELDAATDAGLKAIQIVRPGTDVTHLHKFAKDFKEVRTE